MLKLEDYPHLFPPLGAIPVARGRSFVVPNGSTNLEVPESLIKIPVQNVGWLRQVGVELSAYDDDPTKISYSFLESGQPKRDYTAKTIPIGAPNTPVEVVIDLLADQPFKIVATNQSGANYTMRFWLYGWYIQGRR